MLATLTSRYSDDVLSEMIIAAMKVQNTKKVATNLQTEQVQSCLTAAKSLDDVFNWLLLNKAGDDLLTSPQLATWMNYLKLFNKNNPKQQTTLISAMTESYGDEGVVTILEAAKLVPSTAKTAKRLETEQLQLWLKNKEPPGGVFKALMVNKAGDDLFTSPQLNTFTKYMNSFNKENERQTTLIAAMTTGYGDNKLWTMLQTAKTVPNTKRMATELEAAQYQYWLSSDRGPDEVFEALSLDKAGDNLLSSPQFATFIKYSNDFHAKNPEITTMWKVRAYYTDFDVAKMIMAGEKVPSTQKAAARMEGELFKSWMASPATPDDAFRALKLTSSGDALFENPMLSFWIKFLDDYNKAHPGKNTYRSILTSTYDDKTLVKMIDDAKRIRARRLSKKPATPGTAPDAELFRETKVKGFDPSQFEAEQVFYPSKDGTKIPMFLVKRKNAPKNGELPVYLYGYGGFNISLTPAFSVSRLVFAQHFNGMLALPNLRGGGEYGEQWHQDGMLHKKQNVFDDFHGAAEYLIKEGYTNPEKIAIHGGSNGGLLVAATSNQRPDLYRCVVGAAGVMDMLRFHKFTIGHAWRTDFGDPDVADDFHYIRRYSPLPVYS